MSCTHAPKTLPGLWVSVLLAGLLCAGDARAQSVAAPRVPEQSIKAAYLYKFAGYVEWPDPQPAEPGAPITIGVLGSLPLADELARVTAGRTINNRPIAVRRVTPGDAVDDLHILFIGEREKARLNELLSPARSLPVLTVTESEGALSDGSIINFTVNGQRVRFEISLYAAELSRLSLSSRLLAVAEHVYRTSE